MIKWLQWMLLVPFALVMLLIPAPGFGDIAAPDGLDAAGLAVDELTFANELATLDAIQAAAAQFPRGLPVVVEAFMVYQGAENKAVTAFDIRNVWPGPRTRPMPKRGTRNYTGLIQISTRGIGPPMRRFPGLTLTLEPASQDVDMCGVIHLGVIARFRAWGKDFRYAMPKDFIQWDPNTFSVLKVEDEHTAQTGGLVSRHPGRDYLFYPAAEGSHRIGVTVEGVRATALVNVRPARMSRLEILPGPDALAGGAEGMRAVAHYRDECRPPSDVTEQVVWDSRMALEPRPLRLDITAPAHPSGRIPLCRSVPLQALLTHSPGRRLVTAHYEQLSAAITLDDRRPQGPVDVTHSAGLHWSTGGPVFSAAATGRFSVTATDNASGLSASLTLEVIPPADAPLYPLAGVQVPAILTEGESAALSATAFRCSGAVPAPGLEWISLTPDLISCTASGACTARRAGSATVALMQHGKLAVQRSITIAPQPAPDPKESDIPRSADIPDEPDAAPPPMVAGSVARDGKDQGDSRQASDPPPMVLGSMGRDRKDPAPPPGEDDPPPMVRRSGRAAPNPPPRDNGDAGSRRQAKKAPKPGQQPIPRQAGGGFDAGKEYTVKAIALETEKRSCSTGVSSSETFEGLVRGSEISVTVRQDGRDYLLSGNKAKYLLQRRGYIRNQRNCGYVTTRKYRRFGPAISQAAETRPQKSYNACIEEYCPGCSERQILGVAFDDTISAAVENRAPDNRCSICLERRRAEINQCAGR